MRSTRRRARSITRAATRSACSITKAAALRLTALDQRDGGGLALDQRGAAPVIKRQLVLDHGGAALALAIRMAATSRSSPRRRQARTRSPRRLRGLALDHQGGGVGVAPDQHGGELALDHPGGGGLRRDHPGGGGA